MSIYHRHLWLTFVISSFDFYFVSRHLWYVMCRVFVICSLYYSIEHTERIKSSVFIWFSQSFSSCPSRVNSCDYNVIIVWTKRKRERETGKNTKVISDVVTLSHETSKYFTWFLSALLLFMTVLSINKNFETESHSGCPALSIKCGLSQKSFMSVNCTTKKWISLLRVYFFLTFYVDLDLLILCHSKKVVKKKWEGY